MEGKILKTWWFDYGEPTLFTPVDDHRRIIVLDANVFFDLVNPSKTSRSNESTALKGEWLSDIVRLAVTDEIYVEIDRNPDREERDRRRTFAAHFGVVKHDQNDVVRLEEELRELIPNDGTDSTVSDRKQLAKAIAGGADAFVTRDSALLKLAGVAHRRWRINIVRPLEVVVRADELQRAPKYEPRRLAGTLLTSRLVRAADVPEIAKVFQNYMAREPLAAFLSVLRPALATPEKHTSTLFEADQQWLALEVVRQSPTDRIITLLRTNNEKLKGVLLRHVIWRQLVLAERRGQATVACHDAFLDNEAKAVFRELGFTEGENGWQKFVARGIIEESKLTTLEDLPIGIRKVSAEIGRIESPAQRHHELENLFWPTKVADSPLPNFVMSIKPHWAAQLFEERLAVQTLFGSVPHLALNITNAYYRSARPGVLRAPGRVLWYVTTDRNYPGSGSLRAVSAIERVETGPAKDLFKRYKRLGIYEWRDIAQLTNGQARQQIMTVLFSRTELLPNPVPLSDLRRLLETIEGTKATLQSPLQVSSDFFETVYNRGCAS